MTGKGRFLSFESNGDVRSSRPEDVTREGLFLSFKSNGNIRSSRSEDVTGEGFFLSLKSNGNIRSSGLEELTGKRCFLLLKADSDVNRRGSIHKAAESLFSRFEGNRQSSRPNLVGTVNAVGTIDIIFSFPVNCGDGACIKINKPQTGFTFYA